jgi:hypothetical protein
MYLIKSVVWFEGENGEGCEEMTLKARAEMKSSEHPKS